MKKVYKEVKDRNGNKITIYGSNKAIQLHYTAKGDEYFRYANNRYYIKDFMHINNTAPKWMQEFNGYCNDSFFSGVVIKYEYGLDYDTIKAFTFIC
jgi:hypothetical protein